MFNLKYLAMDKVQMHADAMSKLLYGFASVWAINPLTKAHELTSLTNHTKTSACC